MVIHLLSTPESDESALVGFVVSKGVGNAVVRNRVKRRLRHACAPSVATLPPGTTLVVRALPAAASATFGQLDSDLRTSVSRCLAAAGRARTVLP